MNRVIAALQFIPADERSVWVNMAMAIKSEFGDAGFAIWDDWSQTAHTQYQLRRNNDNIICNSQ